MGRCLSLSSDFGTLNTVIAKCIVKTNYELFTNNSYILKVRLRSLRDVHSPGCWMQVIHDNTRNRVAI